MSNIFCVRLQHALPFSKLSLRTRDATRLDVGGGTPYLSGSLFRNLTEHNKDV